MFDLGDTVPIGVSVYDAASALTNAATTVLTVTLPDGTSATPTVTNPSTGLYQSLYVPTQSGRHLVRWVTTSPNTAHTDSFDVAEAAPPLIVSLSEAKAHLNIDATDTDQDDELRAFLEALTAVVEQRVGPVVRRSVTTTVQRCDPWLRVLPFYPVVSVTSAAYVRDSSSIDVSTWTVDEYGVLRTRDFSLLPLLPYTVTYVVGRPDLPANIRLGALSVLKLAWRSQRGNNPDSFMPFLVANAAAEWFAGDDQVAGFA